MTDPPPREQRRVRTLAEIHAARVPLRLPAPKPEPEEKP